MPRPIRFAAAGDVHAHDANRDELASAFQDVDGTVDLILLAGDLTTYGEPEQAALLAEICRPLSLPVYAVLGNHDWHCDQVPELVALLAGAGVRVLDRSWAIEEVDGASVGIVGLKGFVGGFPDASLPDFGEPLLRQVYAETSADVEALDAGLPVVTFDFGGASEIVTPACGLLLPPDDRASLAGALWRPSPGATTGSSCSTIRRR